MTPFEKLYYRGFLIRRFSSIEKLGRKKSPPWDDVFVVSHQWMLMAEKKKKSRPESLAKMEEEVNHLAPASSLPTEWCAKATSPNLSLSFYALIYRLDMLRGPRTTLAARIYFTLRVLRCEQTSWRPVTSNNDAVHELNGAWEGFFCSPMPKHSSCVCSVAFDLQPSSLTCAYSPSWRHGKRIKNSLLLHCKSPGLFCCGQWFFFHQIAGSPWSWYGVITHSIERAGIFRGFCPRLPVPLHWPDWKQLRGFHEVQRW